MTDTVSATEIKAFRDGFASVLIASTDADNSPHLSYAPTICDDSDNLIIFISELARHTGNLIGNPRTSLMFIEDEAACKNPFARRRLSYDCRVEMIQADTAKAGALLDKLEQRFGNIVRSLRQLPDFHLMRVIPLQGSYVKGFGAAYRWQGALPPMEIDRVSPQGLENKS
jgi:putative heme iron utilization protein